MNNNHPAYTQPDLNHKVLGMKILNAETCPLDHQGKQRGCCPPVEAGGHSLTGHIQEITL